MPNADFPLIADYALIGDCRTAALISRAGTVEWMCLPHFSGPSVFAAILDRQRGGHFAVHPVGDFTSTRRYMDDSNVLMTQFTCESGTTELIDCMPVLADPKWKLNLQPQRELLRRVECTRGAVEVVMEFAPQPDYGRKPARFRHLKALGWSCLTGNQLLHLHSNTNFELVNDGRVLKARARLNEGEVIWLSLSYTCGEIGVIPPLGDNAQVRLEGTLQWWRDWSAQCRYRGPHREHVMRSLLVLKLMTYQLSGAVVAAPTASLPEKIGGVRNWDYRYCWLRDAALTFRAFADLGYRAEADAFLGWMLHATRLTWPELQVLYDVYGETRIDEFELEHFHGYKGSSPVRIGNAAHDQLQLDVYGEVALTAAGFALRGGWLSPDEGKMLVKLGHSVCRRWQQPDEGIWEVRGAARHNTHSKLMCWVALDCLLKLHDKGLVNAPRELFEDHRAAIARFIEEKCYDADTQSYTGAYEYDYVDASLLLMSIYGYKNPDDPRMQSTHAHIRRRLSHNDLLYRYHDGLDGLPEGEGAFVISCFWEVDHLARAGEVDRAQSLFDRLVRLANDVGLMAEEADPEDDSALGNFPQAYSHVGLINAALSLDRARCGQSGGEWC